MFLITRPADKAESTRQLFEQNQLQCTLCPVQQIVAVDAGSAQLQHYDYVIITSTYATNWLAHHPVKADVIIAIGNATAQAIRALPNYDGTQVVTPEVSNSEGVLGMTALREISGCHVLLLKGVGGRDILPAALIEKNARLEVIDVYQRQSSLNDLRVRQVVELPITCIIVTSTEIAELIIRHFPADWLEQKCWIASSERIKQCITSHGFSAVTCCRSASDEALVKVALALQHKSAQC